MSWAFDPSNWASLSHAPIYQDFVNIAGDLHAWGGDVVAGGNVLRTVGAVQLLAGDLPGTAYTVSAGSWSGGTATLTVGTHHVVVGQLVTVASVTPTGYNVSLVAVTAVAATTVSYAVAVNPGAYTSGGTLTVGTTPQSGMIGVDGLGVLKRYFSGAWTSITAASQTPWAQDIDGGGFKLTNITSLVLTPAAVPTGASGRLAVNAAKALQVYDGSAWQYTGLQDPGSNAIVKRTALNTTTAASQGVDYYKPGGTAIAVADLPAMVASGATHAAGIVPDPGAVAGTTKFLREDGSWAIPAATGLADPGANGLVKRTASNVTAAATAGSDYYAPGGGLIAVTDLPGFAGSGTGHRAGVVPDPGASAGSVKFLCENGTWAVPSITAIQGVAVSSATPLDTQVLAYDATAGQWKPTAAGGGGANATQLQARNIDSTAPTDTQVLAWNAGTSKWTPAAAGPAGSYASYGYTSVNQSISNSTTTALAFEQSVFDRGSIHSTSVNNSRFTAPVTGSYLITAGVAFAGAAANATLGLSIRVNGTSIYTNQYTYQVSGNQSWFSVSLALDLNATDYIEAVAWQNSGSALTLNASGNRYCYCQMVKLA